MGTGRGAQQQGPGRRRGATNRCVCPQCGYETTKNRGGVPCRSMKCPQCGTPLMGAKKDIE